jgi:hypothetical protein
MWEKGLSFLWPVCVCCVGGLEKWAGRDSRLPVEDLDGYLRMNGLFRLIFLQRKLLTGETEQRKLPISSCLNKKSLA